MVDKFTDCLGKIVDLDELYSEYTISDKEKVDRLMCIKELGYALYWMDYIYPDLDHRNQRERVITLCNKCEELGNIRYSDYGHIDFKDNKELDEKWDRIWFKLHFKIQGETENMC